MGVYFCQMSVICFCWGFNCCLYYPGVRYSRVSARRELTGFKKQFTITAVRDLRKVISKQTPPLNKDCPHMKAALGMPKI